MTNYPDARIHERIGTNETAPHVVIEGNSGVGKSTLLAQFGTNGVRTVGEYYDFLDTNRGEAFPNFPPENIQSVIESNGLWVELETRRALYRNGLAPTESSPFGQIMDRSPLSLMAFEHAKRVIGLPADLTVLPRRLLDLINEGIIEEPDGYIFLQCSIETIIARRQGLVLPFLIDPQVVNAIDDFTLNFLRRYVPNENYVIYDTDTLSVDDVYARSSQFTHSCFQKPFQMDAMREFLYTYI